MTDSQVQDSGQKQDDQAGTQVLDDQVAPVLGRAVAGKEEEPVAAGEPEKREEAEVREVGKEEPLEVKGWVERVKREEAELIEPVKHRGETLIEPARPKKVKIVLPLSEEGVQKGLQIKLVHSLRWLAEWCMRLVKKFPGKVGYREAKRL